jgi:hypothetical protein
MSTPIAELPYNTATNSVATSLPPRDIPRETIAQTVDPQVNTTYVPPKQPAYIEQQQVQYVQQPTQGKIEKLIEEFKLPILLAVLYFIFQFPAVNAFIIRMIPSVAHNSELTMVGIAVKSFMYGAAYHAAIMGIDYVNQ